MISLQEHVDDYLRLRRGLGFKLERHGQILPQLVTYLEAAGERTVKRELAGPVVGHECILICHCVLDQSARVCLLRRIW